jgi:hypothetical protein
MSRGAAVVLGALVTLVCWGLSSPPGSAPDEPYHLTSIWCGWGVDQDHCRADPDPTMRVVPHQVVIGQCFTGLSDTSAGCRPRDFEKPLEPDLQTAFGNWQHGSGYPPVFYATMRLFATDSYDGSVVLMRVANSVLMVGLVTALALLLPRRLRMLPAYAFLATAVPLALFFVASANPTSWAITSAGTLWLALYGAFETSGRRRWGLVGLAVVATLLGAGARADAALFCILGVGLTLGLQLRRLRGDWPVTLAAGLNVALAAGLYLKSGHASVAFGGIPGYDAAPLGASELLISNLMQAPFLWLAALGNGPLSALGWFDTPIPIVTGIGAVLAFCVVLFHGWSAMWWNKAVAVLVGLAALVAYPVIVLQESGVQAGIGMQPRYVLPLMLLVLGVSLVRRRGRLLTFNRFQATTLTVTLATAQSAVLYANLIRYTEGGSAATPEWLASPDWWWGGMPLSPIAVWVIGSLAFALVAFVVLDASVPRPKVGSEKQLPLT